MVTTGTVSERSAWIRRGWEDARKNVRRELEDMRQENRDAYLTGWWRATRDAARKQG